MPIYNITTKRSPRSPLPCHTVHSLALCPPLKPAPHISCIIFNNKNHKVYDDKRINDTVYYYGQKKGRSDKYIQPNETIYLEKYKNQTNILTLD